MVSTPGVLVENMICTRVWIIAKKETFIYFRSKFRRLWPLLKNISLAFKNYKVRDIRLVTDKELIWCLLEKLVKIETVCGMTCCIDHLGLKPVGSLVLIKYDSCHLYESYILSFEHPILLRSVGSCCRSRPTDGRWQATWEPGGLKPLSIGPAASTRPKIEVCWACHLPYTWSGRCLMYFS
jgi:hypothetical protein